MAKMTRGEMQDLLGKFAIEDSTYRDALLKNPRAVIEKQFNTSLPANVTVRAIEESADTVYVLVPPSTAQVGELDDSDLEKLAGGSGSTKIKGNAECQSGALNTVVSINASLT
jgi:hypothetical protein